MYHAKKLRHVYGKQIAASAPMPWKNFYKMGKVVFGIIYGKGLHTAHTATLQGLSLNGASSVAAQIHKNKIIIYTHTKPKAVYYGWQPYSNGNMLNAAKQPAFTFKITLQ